jgi:hypothetical protein
LKVLLEILVILLCGLERWKKRYQRDGYNADVVDDYD